jgi:type IV pilus assembly protein PilF
MKNTLAYLNVLLSLCLIMSSCKKSGHKIRKSTILYEQSIAQAAKGNMVSALQLINDAIELSPAWHLQASKANYLYSMRDFAQAAELFKKLRGRPDISHACYLELSNNYACALQQLADEQQAIRIWHEIGDDPSYLTPEVAWFNLGIIAWQEQECDKALKLFNKALSRCPNYIDALFYQALILYQQQKIAAAYDTLKKLLIMMPEHAPAQMLLTQWRACSS